MGPYTWFVKRFLVVMLTVVLLASPTIVLAAAPSPSPATGPITMSGPVKSTPPGLALAATFAQTITIPYTFEVIDYSGANTPDLPTLDFGAIAFINQAGSIAVTIFSLLDEHAMLSIVVIILASLGTIFFLWTVVTGKPSTVTFREDKVVSDGEVVSPAAKGIDERIAVLADKFYKAESVGERDRIRDEITLLKKGARHGVFGFKKVSLNKSRRGRGSRWGGRGL